MAATKSRLDLLGLALAHQPVVDEHAGQPVADGALHDRGGDGGVDAAGEARRSPGPSPTCSRMISTCSSTMLSIVQVCRQPAMSCRKCSRTGLAVLGVQHLGVPLDPGEAAVDVLEGRDRGDVGRGEDGEARRAPR